MPTDDQLIPRLARLARLSLTAEEQQKFSEQIPNILQYVDQLSKVDTAAVPGSDQLPARLRADEVEPSTTAADILSRAPDHIDHFWKVPPTK